MQTICATVADLKDRGRPVGEFSAELRVQPRGMFFRSWHRGSLTYHALLDKVWAAYEISAIELPEGSGHWND